MVPDAIPFSSLRRVLVTKLRHHGDVLLSTPVFSALHRASPLCEIDALIYADTAAILDGHPAINRIHRIDRQWKRLGVVAQARAEWRLFSDLRSRDYDLIVHLTEHRRGAWLARLLGPRWAVAPLVKGRDKSWRKSFSHLYPKPLAGGRHTVERNLDALRRLGLAIVPEDRPLSLAVGEADRQSIDALLAEAQVPAGGFVHVHPASRWLFKAWPAERVATLIDRLAEEGWPAVLTAAPERIELALADSVSAACRSKPVNLAGRLNLKQMAALSARARLFVGVDSAPMHIAAAVGTPTVGIFGPSGEIEWHPWGVAHRVVTSDAHPCRPCGIDGCGGGKIAECLTTLTAERVLAACRELL
jgi:heptosyltransferase-3